MKPDGECLADPTGRSKRPSTILPALLGVLWACSAGSTPLDPMSFASFGAQTGPSVIPALFVGADQTLSIDGTTLTVASSAGTGPVRVFYGTTFNQGTGLQPITVFSFSDVVVRGTIEFLSSGSPIALLSRSNMLVEPTLVVPPSRYVGSDSACAVYCPPGTGGYPAGETGGGGFGGHGAGSGGGSPYGDLLSALQGGAPGGRSSFFGRGGGAIELGAIGKLVVGNIVAEGGRGDSQFAGGGSGGGILLHGQTVVTGRLSAVGGAEQRFDTHGGGGRVAIVETGAVWKLGAPMTQSTDVSGGGAEAGEGVVTYAPGTVIVPKGVTAEIVGKQIRIVSGAPTLTHEAVVQNNLQLDPSAFLRSSAFPALTGSFVIGGEFRVDSNERAVLPSSIKPSGGTVIAIGGFKLPDGQLMSGYGSFRGPFSGGRDSTIRALGGRLELGDSTSFQGFATEGMIDIGNREIVLLNRGFASLGSLTQLGSGVLTAANGVSLGTGKVLWGNGVVSADVAAGIGSIIEANGTLRVGNANSTNGFYSDGVLRIGKYTVLLEDRNAAVLGAYTSLEGGVLRGDVVLQSGKVLEGHGLINGLFQNQGDVYGPSDVGGTTLLSFASPVSGAGNFGGRIQFLNTYRPGNSPARVTHENTAFADGSVLEIEIGGLLPGDEFDVVDVTGHVEIGGRLKVVLLGDFVPKLGQSYEILTFETRSGEFSGYDGLSLAEDLVFAPVFSEHALRLDVVTAPVPEPDVWLMLLAGLGCMVGCSTATPLRGRGAL